MWKYIARLCCAIRAYRGQVSCENLRRRERERERERERGKMALMLLAVAPISFCQNVGKRNKRKETVK